MGELSNPYASLTADGVIVLDKNAELYEAFKFMLNEKIMQLPDDRLDGSIAFYKARQNSPEWDGYLESLLWLFMLEQKRRTVAPKEKPRNWIQKLLKGGAPKG